MINQLQSQDIPEATQKKNIQINLKNRPHLVKKHPTTIIKKSNPNINPQLQQQIIQTNQNQNQNQNQRRIPQKPKTTISKKSSTTSKMQNYQNTRINIKIDESWLNKFFIYRHESLNKYLILPEFKRTLDNLPLNYRKQIFAYHRLKPPNNDKFNNAPKNNDIENKNINSNLNPEKKKNKTFIVTGGYCDVVKNLKERGWVKEPNAKSIEFDYIWTLKTNEINFMLLKNNQLCNHYFRNGQITRKSGLSKNIKNLYYKGIDPMNFFPRCYDLSVKTELEDFKQDFKFTWAISLLKLFQKESKEKKNNQIASYRLSSKVISTAINIIERNLFLIENKGQFLKNIDDLIKNNSKIFLVSDEEWNIIYLQELTQNSNVQDIIYEVNSNKPGGVNNPIKGANKTVPKKIIHKPNETKNTLINMNKAQIGVNDNQKFINNLQSISSLKSKISPINDEEKKII